MTNPEVALLMLGLFIVLVLLGFPIAFTLLAMGVAFGYYAYHQGHPIETFTDIFNNNIFYLLNQNTYSVMENPTLVAIPLFLFMGYVVERANIVDKLFFSLYMAARNLPGSLAIAALLTCAVFSTASGIVGAVVTLMGLLAFPAMANANYNKSFASGVICAGGTLGILIPPSIPMIVYGFVTEESVIALFLAGIGPGLVLVGLFIGYAMIYARFSPEYQSLPKASWSERRDASIRAMPSILLAMVVVGGLYTGAFTPTEAAAIGFACALIITIVFLRTLTWQGFKEAVYGSMVTTVAILLIVAGAKVFGKAIALYRIPQDISAFITANIEGPILFILAISVILLLMGLVFEALSMVLIMTPVLLPSALALGFDPIWFGVYMVVLVECALITPPVGLNLYVIQSVARTTLGEVSRGVVPFLALMLATVALLYIFPDMALYIPFKW